MEFEHKGVKIELLESGKASPWGMGEGGGA